MKILLYLTLVLYSCSNSNETETTWFSSNSSGNYSEALIEFQDLAQNELLKEKSKGYLGLAFTQFKIDEHESAHKSLLTGLNLQSDYSTDFKAGLAITYYYLKSDYMNAIKYSSEVISEKSSFKLVMDSEINISDIKLIIALSYFELGDLNLCLQAVKDLDSTVTYSSTNNNLSILLLNKLVQLSKRYKDI